MSGPAEESSQTVLENSEKILKRTNGKKTSAERIDKLISSDYYVMSDAPVLDVAESLKNEKANTAGVINANGEILGIIVRQALLHMLSRQFGREVLKSGKAESVAGTCRHFHKGTGILTVADMISHEMQSEEVTYYIVKDSEEKFCGIFSTNDMLVYLSTLTRRDIELARVIQKGIVKEYQYLRQGSVEIVASSIMSQIVGGDFYAIQKIGKKKLLLSLCDVSGKGVAASLVTAFLYGMVQNYKFYKTLKEFLRKLNDLFIQTFNLEKYVTGQFIILDDETGELTLCEMGHPFAYSFHKGILRPLVQESENLPLGVSREFHPKTVKYQMKPGEILLIITDGITEQTGVNGELFSLENFTRDMIKYETLSLNRIALRVIESFHKFRKNSPLRDDVTFLFFRYNHS